MKPLIINRTCVLDIGSPAVTLAVIRKMETETHGPLVASAGRIAKRVHTGHVTVGRHIRKLADRGYLNVSPSPGHEQRLALRVEDRFMYRRGNEYTALPCAMLKVLPSWSERIVYSLVFSWSRQHRDATCLADRKGSECEPRVFTAAEMSRFSGLSRKSVLKARKKLLDRGVIREVEWVFPWPELGCFVLGPKFACTAAPPATGDDGLVPWLRVPAGRPQKMARFFYGKKKKIEYINASPDHPSDITTAPDAAHTGVQPQNMNTQPSNHRNALGGLSGPLRG